MKRLLLLAAALLGALSTYGQENSFQGTLSFNATGVPLDKRIWVDSTDPQYGGRLAGAGYVVALYWGYPDETDDRNMMQIGAKTSLLGTTGGSSTSTAGTWFGGARTITYNQTTATTGPGAVLSFQVRGWEGTPTDDRTWESIFYRGEFVRIGKSPIFTLKTKNEGDNRELRPNIWQGIGFTGFALTVPEPSVIALSLLTASALIILRRRK